MNSADSVTSPAHSGNASFQSQGNAGRRAYRFSYRPEMASAHGKEQAPTTSTAAPPPRSRPRGRLLIAGLMLAACSAGIATVWDSLLRYKAYGVVTGRTVDIATPLNGVLKYVLVREGDSVRQDDRLATVIDLESEQKLTRIADELRVADATLHAEIARIQWQTHVDETEMTRSIAEFFETSGMVNAETGTLEVLQDQLDRVTSLSQQKAATAADVQSVTIREKAQQERLSELQEALIVMKERARKATQVTRPGDEQIQPLIAKAELLLNEIARLREWIAQGDVRSPVNGVIVKRHHPAGECIKSQEPLLTVVEEASTEIELFLPQHVTDEYKVGDTLRLKIDPIDELVPCVITCVGVEHRKPPEHIEIFYRSNVKLLPVRLAPPAAMVSSGKLTIGAVAKLPHLNGKLH